MDDLNAFRSQFIDVGDARIHVRTGGQGKPLLLLHGFPQTHASWTRIASALSQHFHLVLADLTGYGASTGPAPDMDGSNYSKRCVAGHMLGMMRALGHERFSVAGHDRGARVAYRLALDHPARIDRLALLSILPTFAMWNRMRDVDHAIGTYHWLMLAQPSPIPNDLLAGAPDQQVRNTLASWTKTRTLNAFQPSELAAYVAAFSDRRVIDAVCAEYRAGWTTDRLHDEVDLGDNAKIGAPTLVMWGGDEYSQAEMKASWTRLAETVTYRELDCGHFVVEESPIETCDAMIRFFNT